MNKSLFVSAALLLSSLFASAQTPRKQLTPKPPMGWMTWNLFQGHINEQLIRETADAMVEGGFVMPVTNISLLTTFGRVVAIVRITSFPTQRSSPMA